MSQFLNLRLLPGGGQFIDHDFCEISSFSGGRKLKLKIVFIK